MAAARASRVALPLLLALLTGCRASILTDLIVEEGSKTSCQEGYQLVKGSTLSGDFNQGTDDGHYVILCARFEDLGANHTPGITGLTVVANKDNKFSGCGPLDASLWQRIRQDPSSNGDFNHGAGGSFIYLCYSTSETVGTPIASLSLIETNDCGTSGTRIQSSGDSNGDFNQHAGGKDIFMCMTRACLAVSVVGIWTPQGVVPSGQTTVSVTHGSSTKVDQSQTKDFSSSVTKTISQGSFRVGAGALGPVAAAGGQTMQKTVSRTVGQSFSQSMSNEWSSFQQSTIQVTVDALDKGKTWWQFAFVTTDSCHPDSPTTTLTPQVAFTPGQFQPPCCVPGFALDPPYYTACSSADVQVPGVQCPTTTTSTTTSTSTTTTTSSSTSSSSTKRRPWRQSFLESRGGRALAPGDEDVSAFFQHGLELEWEPEEEEEQESSEL